MDDFLFFLCPVYGAGLTVWYLTRLVVIWCNAAVVVSITQGETQQLNFQNERRNKFAYMYIHRQFTFQLYCYTLSPTPVLCLLVPLARSLTPLCALNLSSRCRAARPLSLIIYYHPRASAGTPTQIKHSHPPDGAAQQREAESFFSNCLCLFIYPSSHNSHCKIWVTVVAFPWHVPPHVKDSPCIGSFFLPGVWMV